MADLQRTEEWFQARCGRVTASRFKDVLAVTKSGPSQKRKDYLVEIVTERLTGQPVLIPQNYAMKWGQDHEDEAKISYSFLHDVEIVESAFIPHEKMMAGCSPDGLISLAGGLEIKCPANSTVHMNTWLSGMPPEHMAQVQGCMWITGREWWEFLSYDPRMPSHLQLYVQRIDRDQDYIDRLEAEIWRFLDEADQLINKLPKAA